MKHLHLLVSVVLALVPAAARAAGETVPCPDQKPGQWYRYARSDLSNMRTEWLMKIERVEGERVVQNEGALVTDKMGNWHQLGRRVATPKWYARIECPFSLGETRVYKDVMYDGVEPGSKTYGSFTVSVDSELVSLTVKAGSFKVVKIVSDHSAYGTGGPGGVWNARIMFVSYYAPEIGISVKNEFTSTLPTQREISELLEYSLAH